MSHREAPSPAPAPLLVFAEEAPPNTDTMSPEDLLRKMIAEKISDAEEVACQAVTIIAEKKRIIAEVREVIGENLATLAGSREEILNLQKQLAILDNIKGGGVPPTNICAKGRSVGEKIAARKKAEKEAEEREVAEMKIAAVLARVHKVVNAGDLTTLSRKGVRQQLSPEFGTEFVWQNKLAINRTIEAAWQERVAAAEADQALNQTQ
jgi:hypothetical protein